MYPWKPLDVPLPFKITYTNISLHKYIMLPIIFNRSISICLFSNKTFSYISSCCLFVVVFHIIAERRRVSAANPTKRSGNLVKAVNKRLSTITSCTSAKLTSGINNSISHRKCIVIHDYQVSDSMSSARAHRAYMNQILGMSVITS